MGYHTSYACNRNDLSSISSMYQKQTMSPKDYFLNELRGMSKISNDQDKNVSFGKKFYPPRKKDLPKGNHIVNLVVRKINLKALGGKVNTYPKGRIRVSKPDYFRITEEESMSETLQLKLMLPKGKDSSCI